MTRKRVEYREIARFPRYRFGSEGSVWSLRARGPDGEVKWRQLFGETDERGRRRLTLRRDDGEYERRWSHCLILEAFKGPCPPGMQACHWDGDTTNNAISNLRWDTAWANHQDKRRHGTTNQGERHPNAKLTESDVVAIRRARAGGEPLRVIAARFGVTPQNLVFVCARKTWRHVPEGQR